MFKDQARKLASVLGMAFLLALFLPKLALADDDDDPPSVVARLAYSQGNVSFQPAGTDDWVAAVNNRPVTTGDKLWSDNDGRVELQLDASSVRLSNNTGFSFLNLDDNITQIRLTEGTINVRVRDLQQNETYEIDTPNLAFTITRPGSYRITVNDGGDSTGIVVRQGEGQVTGGGSSYTVHENDDAIFEGTDQLSADVQDYSGQGDDFDGWANSRDQKWEHSKSREYVSDDVVGYEDLDESGDWGNEAEYGHVWYPRAVAADWAPYHYGHWAYIEPWGYTWVDDASWGFAPFHYGRWVSVRGRWGWIPAPRRVVGVAYVRPVYAPALVAFVGGGGFSVGVSVGGGAAVGWFPLGPREVYVPSYRVSPRYVERVNISNTTVNRTVVNNYYNTTIVNKQVTNVTYVNQRVPGAVVVTSQQTMASAQPVNRNVVRVDQRQIASAQVSVRQPTVVPTRQAVLGGGRAATVRPPAVVQTRAVVARTAAPPPPASFERRQEAIKANGGRPLSNAEMRKIQPAPQAQAQPAVVRVAPKSAQPAVSVRQAPKLAQPPARTATGTLAPRPNQGQPGQQPGQPNNQGNRPATVAPNAQQQNQNRPGQPQPNQQGNQPGNRPVTQPNAAQPNNQPGNRQVTPDNRAVTPNAQPNAQPNTTQPGNRPNDRGNDRPNDRPNRNDRPANATPNTTQPNTAQPGNRQVTPDNRAVSPNTQPNAQPNATQPGNRPNDRGNDRANDRPNRSDRPANATPNASQPNTVQPGNRPNDRSVTQPNTAQPNNRPAERPAPNVQPNNRPADRSNDRPNANDRPNNRQAERPAQTERPAPSAKPAERPAPQQDRPAARQPERQERQQQDRPAARQQERPQQERPRSNEKPPKEKDKDKDKPPKPR